MQITDMLNQYNRNIANGTEISGGTQGIKQIVSTLQEMSVGNVFEGSITHMENGTVTLGLPDGKSIQARLDAGVSVREGESMFFQVRSNNGTQIAIRPFSHEEGANPTLLNALKAANLQVNGKMITMVNSMMEQSMPIDKQSLAHMARLVMGNQDMDIASMVQMEKLGIPITEEMAAQFENYKSDQYAILDQIESVMEQLPDKLAGQSLSQEELLNFNQQMARVFLGMNEQGEDGTVLVNPERQAADGTAANTEAAGQTAERNGINIVMGEASDGVSVAGQDASGAVAVMEQGASESGMAAVMEQGVSENGAVAVMGQGASENGTVTVMGQGASENGTAAVMGQEASENGTVTVLEQGLPESGTETVLEAGGDAAAVFGQETEAGAAVHSGIDGQQASGTAAVFERGASENDVAAVFEREKGEIDGIAAKQPDPELLKNTFDPARLAQLGRQLARVPELAENPALFQDGKLSGDMTARQLLQFVEQAFSSKNPFSRQALGDLVSSKEYRSLIRNVMERQWLLRPEELKTEHKVSELYERLDRQLEQMEKVLKSFGQGTQNLSNTAANVRDNIQFMHQINQAYAYIQVPLKFAGQNAHSDLYVYTDRRKAREKDGELTAFLHLDLDNLGSTDVSIKLLKKKVSTNFYLADDTSYDLILENMDLLIQRLEAKGYQAKVQVVNQEEKVNFVEDMLRQGAPSAGGMIHRYSFDVRA